MGMVFRVFAVPILMGAMLGPMTAESVEVPICSPPALRCSMFKRSVCEWSASGEPVWACRGYFEVTNAGPRKPIINGGRSMVDQADSSSEEEVILGTYEYQTPQGRQLISHHEPDVHIGTYTYPATSKKKSADEEPNTILHTGTYTPPVAPPIVADGESDAILYTGTYTLPGEPKKINSIGLQPDVGVHIGSNTHGDFSNKKGSLPEVAMDSNAIPNTLPAPANMNPVVDADSSHEIHFGTYLYDVPSEKKSSASKPSESDVDVGGHTVPVPPIDSSGIAHGQPGFDVRKGSYKQQVLPKQESLGSDSAAMFGTQLASLAASRKGEESDFIHVGTVTYQVPLKRRSSYGKEESGSELGLETYAMPVPIKMDSVAQIKSEPELLLGTVGYHVPSKEQISAIKSESVEKSGRYSLPPGERSVDSRAPDPDISIGTYKYRIPAKSGDISGPNKFSASVKSSMPTSGDSVGNSLQFGNVAHSDAYGEAKREPVPSNLGGGSAVQQNVGLHGGDNAIDAGSLSLSMSKKGVHSPGIHVEEAINELPIVSIRSGTHNALSGVDGETIDNINRDNSITEVPGILKARLTYPQEGDAGFQSSSRSAGPVSQAANELEETENGGAHRIQRMNLVQQKGLGGTVDSTQMVGPSRSIGDFGMGTEGELMAASGGRVASENSRAGQNPNGNSPLSYSSMNGGNYQQHQTAVTRSAHQTQNFAAETMAQYGYGYPFYYGYGGYRIPVRGSNGYSDGWANGFYNWPQSWTPLVGVRQDSYGNWIVGQNSPLVVNPILHGHLSLSSYPVYYGIRSNSASGSSSSTNSLTHNSLSFYSPFAQYPGVGSKTGSELQTDICDFCTKLISLLDESDARNQVQPMILEFFKKVYELLRNRLAYSGLQ